MLKQKVLCKVFACKACGHLRGAMTADYAENHPLAVLDMRNQSCGFCGEQKVETVWWNTRRTKKGFHMRDLHSAASFIRKR